MKKRAILIVSVLLAFCLLFSGCGIDGSNPQGTGPSQITSTTSSNSSGSYSRTTNYSNGRATSTSTTYSNGHTIIRKK